MAEPPPKCSRISFSDSITKADGTQHGDENISRQKGDTILDNLFMRIEDAENALDDALAYREAIIALANNQPAVNCLLNEYRDTSINAEKLWREIEQMPEFRQRYKSRDDCRVDFLHQYYSKD